MKHLMTFNESLNEGWLTDWLFKKTYKVNYTVELTDVETKEPVSYKSYLTVKAKNEEDAREKFYTKWEEATKELDIEPIIGNIKKTDKADKINIVLPKTVKKASGSKDIIKKTEEPKKELPSKKKEVPKKEEKGKKK